MTCPIVVGDEWYLFPTEQLHVVWPLDGVRRQRRQPGRTHRGEVDAAAQLAEHHAKVDRSRRSVGRHRFGAHAREQGVPTDVDCRDNGRRGVRVFVEPRHVGKRRPAEIVVRRHVGPGRVTWRHDRLCRVPHVRQQSRFEVAERARDHRRLDVAEHAATAEEVHPEAVEPEAFGLRNGGGVEVERGTDVARLSGGRGDGRQWIHDGILTAAIGRRRTSVSRPRSCGSRRSSLRRDSRRRPGRRGASTDPWRPRARRPPYRPARWPPRCRARG